MPGFLVELCAGILAAFGSAAIVAGAIGRMGFHTPPPDRRIGCIDGLRGYLALAVMCHHFTIWMNIRRSGAEWTAPSANLLNQLGAGGVSLFFMITGLLFYPRILAGLRNTNWLQVYISRLFRIMPMVVFSVAGVTIVIMGRIGHTFDSVYLAAALTWISTTAEPPLFGYPDSRLVNAGVLWSLEYEWQFYLFALPLCAALMEFVMARRLPSWGLLVVLAVVVVLYDVLPWQIRDLAPFFKYLVLFGVGMLAYECQRRESVRRFFTQPLVSMSACLALVVAAVASPDPYGWSLPLFAWFFISVACGNSIGGLLLGRGAIVLGEISFGIYVLHGILLSILFVELEPLVALVPIEHLPVVLPIAALAMVPLAVVTYLLIERPGMQAGRRLSGWIALQRSIARARGLGTAS